MKSEYIFCCKKRKGVLLGHEKTSSYSFYIFIVGHRRRNHLLQSSSKVPGHCNFHHQKQLKQMNIYKGLLILGCIAVLQGCTSSCTPNKCHAMDYSSETISEAYVPTVNPPNELNEPTPSQPYNKESAPGPLPIMGLLGFYFFAKKLKNKM